MTIGTEALALAERLFPICRSITGDGVRQTLAVLADQLPGLTVHEVPSGTRCFDWTVPDEWNIRSASLVDPRGVVVADFERHNLHVVGYSEPVDCEISLADLQPHLYSLQNRTNAIPYVTSYYKRTWGFCIPHVQREALPDGMYRASIEATLAPGHMTYADLIIPGQSEREVLLSTYVCHPSMANNELSGIVVTAALAKWLAQGPRRFTYRIVFVPETIGAIVYISKHLDHLKRNVVAGFQVTCVGDERSYSYLSSRRGGTLADRVALRTLQRLAPGFLSYRYLDRGSDERQYCSPGVDLPVCSVMRSKYGAYPEYHTSDDNFALVTARGLQGGFDVLQACISELEGEPLYRASFLCEPQLGRRGLYGSRDYLEILAQCDGATSADDLADLAGCSREEASYRLEVLATHNLIERIA